MDSCAKIKLHQTTGVRRDESAKMGFRGANIHSAGNLLFNRVMSWCRSCVDESGVKRQDAVDIRKDLLFKKVIDGLERAVKESLEGNEVHIQGNFCQIVGNQHGNNSDARGHYGAGDNRLGNNSRMVYCRNTMGGNYIGNIGQVVGSGHENDSSACGNHSRNANR